MQRLTYRITTLAPVLVTNHGGDPNMTTTARYIPGSTVWGIFATKFPAPAAPKRKDQEDLFYQWFLQGRLKFHNAYIVDKQETCDYNCVPVPYSIQKEKKTADIWDLLLADERDEIVQPKHEPGFCCLQEEQICFKSVKSSLNFHHARDEKTGTSKEGQIFNYEAICNNQVFEGCIEGTPDDLQQFRKIFADSAYTFYVGRSRSAQYGKVKLEFLPEDQDHNDQPSSLTPGELSLTLLSDTIIYNDNGFSTTDIGCLKNLLGVEIKRTFARAGTVQNYVAVWNMKRPAEICFAAGSCFLLHAQQADIPKLLKFQEHGLGERTQEGFGRIALGWQTKAKLIDATSAPSSVEAKPAGEIPPLTYQILAAIVTDLVQQQVILKAMERAHDFCISRPSKSLISRLESIAKVADQPKLQEFLKQLRDTAKKQLEACRDKRITLLDFLSEPPQILQEIERSNGYLKNLLDDAKLKLGQSPLQPGDAMDRLYLITFFSHMRKELKGAKHERR